jgi:hypothetical protein
VREEMSTEERVTAQLPSNFDRDLENARVLIEEPPWKDNPQKYRKVAEGILRRILTYDPTNKSAQRLLQKSVEIAVPAVDPGRSAVHPGGDVPIPAPKIETPPPPKMDLALAQAAPPRRPVTPPDFSFVVETGRTGVQKKERPTKPPQLLLAIATVGVIAGVTLLVAHRNTFTAPYVAKAPTAAPTVVRESAAVVPVASPEPSSSVAATETPVRPAMPVPFAALVEPASKREVVPANPAAVVKSNAQSAAHLETGTLAVSSAATVDIYRGDQLVGSAPTTLVLPAGSQTIEYRHQDLRKSMTYVIKANETTTAMVNFDVTVQINAKPWAQVFIDGLQRRSLGQTPLSDVRVPIGSNLVFENPNFPGKSYRITGKETEIRVTFP